MTKLRDIAKITTSDNKTLDLTQLKLYFNSEEYKSASDYSSNSNGEGASLIGVEDVADNFTATTVEGVLAELYSTATTGIEAGSIDETLLNVSVNASLDLADSSLQDSDKGVANGLATLDSSGQIPVSQLPVSAMEFKGSYNADSNTPDLSTNYTGSTGDVYVVSVQGTQNLFGSIPSTYFNVGDHITFDGSTFVHQPKDTTLTNSEVKIAYESNADTNAFTDSAKTKVDFVSVTQPIDLDANQIKLNNIESNATADQTGAEIKIAYEGEADTNAFTDSDKTKVDFISVTQAVDLDTIESDIASASSDITNIETKTDFISVTQSVDLDTMESNIATNIVDIAGKQDELTAGTFVTIGTSSSTSIVVSSNDGTSNGSDLLGTSSGTYGRIDINDTNNIRITPSINVGDIVEVTDGNSDVWKFKVGAINGGGLTQSYIQYETDASYEPYLNGSRAGSPHLQDFGDINNNDPSNWTINVVEGSDAIDVNSDTIASDSNTAFVTASNIKSVTDAIEAKTDFISVTQAVDLDTIESDLAGKQNALTHGDGVTVENDVVSVDLYESGSSQGLLKLYADSDTSFNADGVEHYSTPSYDWLEFPVTGFVYTSGTSIKLSLQTISGTSSSGTAGSGTNEYTIWYREDPNNVGEYQIIGRKNIGGSGTVYGYYGWGGITSNPSTLSVEGDNIHTYNDSNERDDNEYGVVSQTYILYSGVQYGFDIASTDSIAEDNTYTTSKNFFYRYRTDSGNSDYLDSVTSVDFNIVVGVQGYIGDSGLSDIQLNTGLPYSIFAKDNGDSTWTLIGRDGIAGNWYTFKGITTDPSTFAGTDQEVLHSYATSTERSNSDELFTLDSQTIDGVSYPNDSFDQYLGASVTQSSYLEFTDSKIHVANSLINIIESNTAKISYDNVSSTKVDNITVTQAVDLDTMESDISNIESEIGDISFTPENYTQASNTVEDHLKAIDEEIGGSNKIFISTVNHDDSSVVLIDNAPNGASIMEVWAYVDTEFDGTTPTISIGTPSSSETSIVNTTKIDVSTTADNPIIIYGWYVMTSTEDIVAHVNTIGSTQGSVRIAVKRVK